MPVSCLISSAPCGALFALSLIHILRIQAVFDDAGGNLPQQPALVGRDLHLKIQKAVVQRILQQEIGGDLQGVGELDNRIEAGFAGAALNVAEDRLMPAIWDSFSWVSWARMRCRLTLSPNF